jgi:hypothetical protein
MAVKEQNGWVWTEQEKQWIKTWKPYVQFQSKKLTTQVDRFQKGLPKFADEAAKAAQSYLRAAKALLTLAEQAKSRPYLPVSPEEAKQLLYGFEDQLLPWKAFTRCPEVQAAILAHNRALQKKRREPRSHRQEAREERSE